MNELKDEDIISSVRHGTVRDFRYLIERHSAMAYHTAFSVCRIHEDAQEIMQDAFLKAFNSLGSFQGKSKFSTWLFRIVYYTALNHLEKANHYKKHIDLNEVNESEYYTAPVQSWKRLINSDRVKYVEKALDRLNAEDRVALTLYYLEEKSQKEITEITGWNLAATKIRIHRGRSKLNHFLGTILKDEKNSLL